MYYSNGADIVWDEGKNEQLKAERGLSFEVFAEMILRESYIAVKKNPVRKEQMIFLCRYQGYIHVVPFVVDDQGCIVLKTVFPSRKYQKWYGGDLNERDQFRCI